MTLTHHPNPMLHCMALAGQLWPGLRIFAEVTLRREHAKLEASRVEVYAATYPNASRVLPAGRRHRRDAEVSYDPQGHRHDAKGDFRVDGSSAPLWSSGDGREYEHKDVAAAAAWTKLAGKLTLELTCRGTPEEWHEQDAAATKECVDRDAL